MYMGIYWFTYFFHTYLFYINFLFLVSPKRIPSSSPLSTVRQGSFARPLSLMNLQGKPVLEVTKMVQPTQQSVQDFVRSSMAWLPIFMVWIQTSLLTYFQPFQSYPRRWKMMPCKLSLMCQKAWSNDLQSFISTVKQRKILLTVRIYINTMSDAIFCSIWRSP